MGILIGWISLISFADCNFQTSQEKERLSVQHTRLLEVPIKIAGTLRERAQLKIAEWRMGGDSYIDEVCNLIIALSENQKSTTEITDNWNWAGSYIFDEVAFQSFMSYTLIIQEEQDDLVAYLTVDGQCTMRRMKAKVLMEENNNKITLECCEDYMDEGYYVGKILLSLTKQDGILITEWETIKPLIIAHEKPGPYFNKVTEITAENQEVRKIYHEFIDGKSSIAGMKIFDICTPTGEPDKRYKTDYTILDCNGDGIPELCIQTGREFYVFSHKDGKADILVAYFSDSSEYEVLKDGAFVYCPVDAIGTGHHRQDYYCYFRLDALGNEVDKIKFYWTDINENNIYDDSDEYGFKILGDEEKEYDMEKSSCTKEEWFEKTRKYLYTDENGKEQIRNQVDWITYCEKR